MHFMDSPKVNPLASFIVFGMSGLCFTLTKMEFAVKLSVSGPLTSWNYWCACAPNTTQNRFSTHYISIEDVDLQMYKVCVENFPNEKWMSYAFSICHVDNQRRQNGCCGSETENYMTIPYFMNGFYWLERIVVRHEIISSASMSLGVQSTIYLFFYFGHMISYDNLAILYYKINIKCSKCWTKVMHFVKN
jgi:hypothetical protein